MIDRQVRGCFECPFARIHHEDGPYCERTMNEIEVTSGDAPPGWCPLRTESIQVVLAPERRSRSSA